MNEREAIARLRRGEIDGLEALVEAYQVRAVHVAVLITADRASAEDAAQNAFLTAFRRIEQYDETRPFAPWFLTIVANEARKTAARGRSTISLDAGDVDLAELLPDPLGELPEDAAQRAELRERLRQALARLTPGQRALVVMRYFLDFSEAEMAREADVPASTVKWRLYSARLRLRAWLRPLWERRG